MVFHSWQRASESRLCSNGGSQIADGRVEADLKKRRRVLLVWNRLLACSRLGKVTQTGPTVLVERREGLVS